MCGVIGEDKVRNEHVNCGVGVNCGEKEQGPRRFGRSLKGAESAKPGELS